MIRTEDSEIIVKVKPRVNVFVKFFRKVFKD